MCSLHARCAQGQMFRLADRQGYACHNERAQGQCSQLLNHLRQQTRFVFKLNEIDGPLPHNKEIRVQNGGLIGLRKLLGDTLVDGEIEDVNQLISQVLARYGSIDRLPFDVLMQSVTGFKARPKRRKE
ncbi:MAG: hypothetical protein OEY43_04030 [Gammaproteobacteria bacterium]|nr:hypothetical protein [Gammaproteobacteria bacterium]